MNPTPPPPPPGAPFPPAPVFPPPPGAKPTSGPAPAPSFPPPGGGTKFPVKAPTGGLKPLVLPRRVNPLQRAQEATQATIAARKSIDAIMSTSRAPWGGKTSLSGAQVEELEKALRALEAKVGEREMALADAENKLAEKDRALAETEALLQAREKVIDAMRKQQTAEPSGGAGMNPAELEALGKLKEELDRQEASMKEQRAAIQEREDFLNQSEASLFEKMQAQQEKETELEQKEEDLKRMARQLGVLKDEPKEPIEKA